MKTVLGLFALFFETSKLRLSQAMAYRLNFILHTLISLAFSSIGPVLQYLIFSQTRGFPGWNLKQIVLFQGILLLHLGLRSTLFGALHYELPQLIRQGQFDRLLLKPYPAIGTILAGGFDANHFGSILAGTAIITGSVLSTGMKVGILELGTFAALILMGLFLYMSFEILYAAAVIILVRMGRLYDIMGMLHKFGEYPLEIFTPAVRLFFITAAPMAIWVNYPAQVLLGRQHIHIWYSLICAVLFFSISLLVWRKCLGKYTSAGG
ncbi:MAG: ABC-2 family transporter protein [Spirochaetales bacterium]|nr:ABC-2 family transporter protein [Spirochaetales bacterium]